MKPTLSQMAVINLEKDEEIFGGWASPRIPQVGIYKLLAKKKADGSIEWAHFVQRDNGVKEKVMRGTVNTPAEFDAVRNAIDGTLRRIMGVTMQACGYDVRTLDGNKASDTMH